MRSLLFGCAVGGALVFGHAVAARAQAPQRTTASYEDWTVRCEIPAGSTVKACEMVQTTQMQGQATPVTQLAIGRPNKNEPLRIVVQVPVNVYLPAGLKLIHDEKQQPLAFAFSRCLPIGCFGDTSLAEDLVKRLRGHTAPGRIEFKDASMHDVRIPVSFKGFAQAYDALLKE